MTYARILRPSHWRRIATEQEMADREPHDAASAENLWVRFVPIGQGLAWEPSLEMLEIDVVMPCGQDLRFLPQSVSSILKQTGVRTRLVLVDDTSGGVDSAILHEVAESDPRITLIKSTGVGIVDALNTGLGEVQTPLFARMDADDVALPGRLLVQARVFQQSREVAGVGGLVHYIDENGRGVNPQWMWASIPHGPREIRRALRRFNCMFHPTMLLSTDLVRSVGGYRAEYHYLEDYDLWLRLSEKGDLHNVPRVVLHYRLHANQVGRERAAEQERELERLRSALSQGLLDGVSATPALETSEFAAVLFARSKDGLDALLRALECQGGYRLRAALVLVEDGPWQVPETCELSEDVSLTVKWKADLVDHMSEMTIGLAADTPVVFLRDDHVPHSEWVSESVEHLLEAPQGWVLHPSWQEQRRQPIWAAGLDDHDEVLLERYLVAEARVLRASPGVDLAVAPLINLVATWHPSPVLDVPTSEGAKGQRPGEALQRTGNPGWAEKFSCARRKGRRFLIGFPWRPRKR